MTLHHIQYAPYEGKMDEAERERMRRHPLYAIGDTVLVWVNEGDLYMVGERVNGERTTEEIPCKPMKR